MQDVRASVLAVAAVAAAATIAVAFFPGTSPAWSGSALRAAMDDAAGGDLRIRSVPGRGTDVEVEL